jgi:hypothetical protein
MGLDSVSVDRLGRGTQLGYLPAKQGISRLPEPEARVWTHLFAAALAPQDIVARGPRRGDSTIDCLPALLASGVAVADLEDGPPAAGGTPIDVPLDTLAPTPAAPGRPVEPWMMIPC